MNRFAVFVSLFSLLCFSLKLNKSEKSAVEFTNNKPPPEPWYGDYAGEIKDIQKVGIKGHVYVVNNTCLQILGFTFHGNVTKCKRNIYFWLSYDSTLTPKGIALATFDHGLKPIIRYENARVVLNLPAEKPIKDFQSFGLWCPDKDENFGFVNIPKDKDPPSMQYVPNSIITLPQFQSRKISFSPILIMDRKTIKIYSFSTNFPANNLYIVAGKGLEEKDVMKHNFIHVKFQGETFKYLPKCEGEETKDFIIELNENMDVYDIDWLAVAWATADIPLVYVKLTNISSRIPPYVPVPTVAEQRDQPNFNDDWPRLQVVGNKVQNTLTFQLGAPGGSRSYSYSFSPLYDRIHQYVWYVNGLMTPEIWLEKDVTYTFIIEGGDDRTHLYHPLYISNDSNGGYMKSSQQDKLQIAVFAGLDSSGNVLNNETHKSFGSLCIWMEKEGTIADDYDSFVSYRDFALTLKCLGDKAGHFQWTPTSKQWTMKDNRIYYQSYTEPEMGGKIHLFDGNSQQTIKSSESTSNAKREQTTKDQIPIRQFKKPNVPRDVGGKGIASSMLFNGGLLSWRTVAMHLIISLLQYLL